MSAVKPLPSFIPTLFGGLCLGGAVFLFGKISTPFATTWEFLETEEGREIGGLAILAFEMSLILLSRSSSFSPHSRSESSGIIARLLYLVGVVIVAWAFYATFFLQPEMNARLDVEHCKGSFAK